MSRLYSHIATAEKIIESYNGLQPFAQWLKIFFAADRKYGSKDRKTIASLCYYYYRTGHAWKDKPAREKMAAGIFLCEHTPNDALELIKPEWNKEIMRPFKEKSAVSGIKPTDIFPFAGLSDHINAELYSYSMLIKPHLFLRIRPGKKEQVLNKLAGTDHRLDGDCIELPDGTKADTLFEINKEVVIQDMNSQHVLDLQKQEGIPEAWDCCAASGGKSILLYD